MQSFHDGKFWAAKVVAKSSIIDKSTKKKLLAEINIHRSLKHSNIVRFYNVVEDKDNIYLILELCENRVSTSNWHCTLLANAISPDAKHHAQKKRRHVDRARDEILHGADLDCTSIHV